MLKGISPLVSPELLAVLARMGHGDEIILADAHFPGESYNGRVLRADGLRIPELLAAILPLFELDAYVPHPLVMMAAVNSMNNTCSVRVARSLLMEPYPELSLVRKADVLHLVELQI